MDTVKIKIAVCVDSKGHYNSCGWHYGDNNIKEYEEMLNLAQEGLDFPPINKTFWLSAEIPIPTEAELPGKVDD